jgi:hypothetical protein
LREFVALALASEGGLQQAGEPSQNLNLPRCAALCYAVLCCVVLCPAVRYPVNKMQEFVGRLHVSGQRWIPITDAGVAAAEGYGAYEKGLAMDVFVKDHNGQPYMGQVRWLTGEVVTACCLHKEVLLLCCESD